MKHFRAPNTNEILLSANFIPAIAGISFGEQPHTQRTGPQNPICYPMGTSAAGITDSAIHNLSRHLAARTTSREYLMRHKSGYLSQR